ncbi:MAG: sel1 repeat family protein [Betaproteobacteria bacterium]|nr:sel1 repeat family protein [Pseudomonadota bacterium]NBO12337.1 sel1 repeat family protein [Betaproteobacteria bacterium]NBO44152.1 sel1 repeat family protein [Betaproteobacteria bacterium]NBP10084.1 sel1 repeat family protein [Betaproteobacteria bacterium]NBP61878.1 sel1 repeat family protein [Betaproteobacteria bacterium]
MNLSQSTQRLPDVPRNRLHRWGKFSVLSLALVSSLCLAQTKSEPKIENAEAMKGATAAMNTMEFKRAIETLKPLADKGDANAQFNLGAIYANGRGIPPDPREAVRLYRLAAAKGHLGAMNNLAFMLKTGSGTEKNDREALSWYEKIAASERDDPGAKAMKNIAAKNIESIKGCLALPNGCDLLPANDRKRPKD